MRPPRASPGPAHRQRVSAILDPLFYSLALPFFSKSPGARLIAATVLGAPTVPVRVINQDDPAKGPTEGWRKALPSYTPFNRKRVIDWWAGEVPDARPPREW